MSKICPVCGKKHEAANTCPYCDAMVDVSTSPVHVLLPPFPPVLKIDYSKFPDTEENRGIFKKIAPIRAELASKTWLGPFILGTVGAITCLIVFIHFIGLIIGLALIVVAWWWNRDIDVEVVVLKNKITELETELESFDCNQAEIQRQEAPIAQAKAEKARLDAENAKALLEFHETLVNNLNAATVTDLKDLPRDDIFNKMMVRAANSLKNDEKLYVACAAKAKRLKYVKSQRAYYGVSAPVYGLKGFRVHGSYGQSEPVYDYVDIGAGSMILTDKNIHLCASSGRPLKIPYNKIQGFHLYNDGLELYHGLQQPTVFVLNEIDPMQSDVIGHIIDLHTR